jgi:hypothetical protein
MVDKPWGFFEGTEMPTSGWWEALWPDPVGVLVMVGVKSHMDVIDLCSAMVGSRSKSRSSYATSLQSTSTSHRVRESGVETGDFVVGNANDIRRLWPQPVDFVFLASAFHGVADRGCPVRRETP